MRYRNVKRNWFERTWTDFFGPRWKHSKANIRMAAIEKIQDQNLLHTLATTDASCVARDKAAQRISDETLLKDLVMQHHTVSYTALNNISDQAILADIALNHQHDRYRQVATRRISAPDILERIARNDPASSVRETAVSKLEDQDDLADIARSDSCDGVRTSAVKVLSDQDVLNEFAKNKNLSRNVRAAAIAKLLDERAVAEIALTEESPYLYSMAYDKISDNTMRRNVASESKVSCKAAVAILSNENTLTRIAKNHTNECSVRKDAVGKLSNQDVLLDIALTDPDYGVCLCAVRGLKNEDALATIARKRKYTHDWRDRKIQESAVKRLSPSYVSSLPDNDPIIVMAKRIEKRKEEEMASEARGPSEPSEASTSDDLDWDYTSGVGPVGYR